MISEELAELAGLFAADGCMQDNGQTKYICFWGSLTEDRAYYEQTVVPLFKREFGIIPRAHPKPSNSVFGFYICNKEIIDVFKRLGFNPGRKSGIVEIPQLVLSASKSTQIAFIRGFFDGDGSLNFLKRKGSTYSRFNLTHHTYPRINISSTSSRIIIQLHQLLVAFGFRCTLDCKSGREKNQNVQYRITIRGVSMIERWMSLIGINNPAQKSRYLLWKKQGYCPTHTTLAERQKALI